MDGAQYIAAAEPIGIDCADGLRLAGHLWPSVAGAGEAVIIVNAATGVRADYYHRYAAFLAAEGFDALTYDYRGVGRSRPARLRGCGYRWSDWGRLDFEATLRVARARAAGRPILVVGHSIGGFLPGLAPSAPVIERMLTIGAQHAWWGDYAAGRRATLFAKWHLVMPLLTALVGYFPGRRLGWLEDLPAGVAYEWSFRRSRFELSHPREERATIRSRFAAVTAPILAVCVADDDLAPAPAIRRGLAHYPQAPSQLVEISPEALGVSAVGHVGLFHAKHEPTFWRDSLRWLRDGRNPWIPRQPERPPE